MRSFYVWEVHILTVDLCVGGELLGLLIEQWQCLYAMYKCAHTVRVLSCERTEGLYSTGTEGWWILGCCHWSLGCGC